MDFKDMTYILAIANYQNISKAAENLYLSQPTLTKFLQRLEENLGQKLFKKIGHKFIPTYIGERYIEKAKEILIIKKDLDNEIADIVKENVGVLNLAFPVMRGTYMLPCTLPIFHGRYPNIKINLYEHNSSMLDSMIINGDTDLAFFNLSKKNPMINYKTIAKEEMVLVVAENHPYCKYSKNTKNSKFPWIDMHLFNNEIVMVQNPKQRTRQVMEEVFEKENISYSHQMVTSNIHASIVLASKGYGIAFVCSTHLKHINLESPVKCFSFGKSPTKVDFVAAYRKGTYLPSYAVDYINIVKQFT